MKFLAGIPEARAKHCGCQQSGVGASETGFSLATPALVIGLVGAVVVWLLHKD